MLWEVVNVTKTVSLPNIIYDDLEAISEELARVAGKPVSLSMAVYLLTEVFRAHMRDACARDLFRQRLANADLMSPEEFEQAWDKKEKNVEKEEE